MGTLFEQQPRNYKTIDQDAIENAVSMVQLIAHDNDAEVKDVIEVWKTLEIRRRNDLYVANGDVFDEQIGGIGLLLKEIIDIVRYDDI